MSTSVGRLENRVAIVTGGSSGLGRCIALLFARSGARICIVDLYDRPRNATNPATGKADDFNNRVEEGASVVEAISEEVGEGRAIFVRADVTVAAEVERAVARCK
jgi:NAD(P)-dependent dehydrogenase (short-subunit alcohol dehydrogenase family)